MCSVAHSHQASQAQPEVAPTQPEEVLLACHCVGVEVLSMYVGMLYVCVCWLCEDVQILYIG